MTFRPELKEDIPNNANVRFVYYNKIMLYLLHNDNNGYCLLLAIVAVCLKHELNSILSFLIFEQSLNVHRSPNLVTLIKIAQFIVSIVQYIS